MERMGSLLVRRLPSALAVSALAVVLSAALALPGLAQPDPAAAAAPAATQADPEPVDPDLLSALQRDLGLTADQARQRLADDAAATRLADTLGAALHSSFAGAWVDQATGDLVVATTDPAAVERIRDAGARPQVVSRDVLSLDRVLGLLDSAAAGTASVPDAVTGWYIDPASNEVVVSATDPAAARSFVARTLGAAPDGVRVEKVDARPTRYASLVGGEGLETSDGGRCSIGFNATRGDSRYVITAGHCTDLGGTWYGEDGSAVGPVVESSFPGNDFGLIEVSSPSWQQTPLIATRSGTATITGAGQATVGTSICRSGSSSGYRCGTVRSLNETINYGGGDVVNGLTKTSACAQPGDSGGPFVAGTQAQGVLSGGLGGCLLGGETYFQPIGEILDTYGLSLVTGSQSARGEAAPPAEPPSNGGLLCSLFGNC